MKLSTRGARWLPVRRICEAHMELGKRWKGGICRDVRSVFTRVPHGGPHYGSAFLGIKGQIGHAREGKLSNYQFIKLAN